MKEAIEVENLSKNYKDFSLKNISFNVPKGSIVGLIGENGARKNYNNKINTKYYKFRWRSKNIWEGYKEVRKRCKRTNRSSVR